MHVTKHQKAHLDTALATGTGIPKSTKVRKILKSLKVSSMAIPAATIRATDKLRGSIKESVNYLPPYICSSDNVEERAVSAAKTDKESKKCKGKNQGGKGDSNGAKKPKNIGLDWYYFPKEW
jgi:hypothetical protein